MVAKLKKTKPGTRAKPQQAPQWPADKVERRPIAKLLPYARNARTHSDAQIAAIAASIKEWGWTMPLLIDESGGLIARPRPRVGGASAPLDRGAGMRNCSASSSPICAGRTLLDGHRVQFRDDVAQGRAACLDLAFS